MDIQYFVLNIWKESINALPLTLVVNLITGLLVYFITSRKQKICVYYKKISRGINIAIQNNSKEYIENSSLVPCVQFIKFNNNVNIKKSGEGEFLYKLIKSNVFVLYYLNRKTFAEFSVLSSTWCVKDKISCPKIKFECDVHQKGYKGKINVYEIKEAKWYKYVLKRVSIWVIQKISVFFCIWIIVTLFQAIRFDNITNIIWLSLIIFLLMYMAIRCIKPPIHIPKIWQMKNIFQQIDGYTNLTIAPEIGKKVKIDGGPFRGFDGKIIQIDKRQKYIGVKLNNKFRTVWVLY